MLREWIGARPLPAMHFLVAADALDGDLTNRVILAAVAFLVASPVAARTHGNRLYNFRGLERFRMKMAPRRWDPVFAISSAPRFSPATLFHLGSAFFAA